MEITGLRGLPLEAGLVSRQKVQSAVLRRGSATSAPKIKRRSCLSTQRRAGSQGTAPCHGVSLF